MRWGAGLLLLTGCRLVNYEETTTVRVRNTDDVSVGVATPRGGEWLLPSAKDDPNAPRKADVPGSTPPLTEGFKYATVERSFRGVGVTCPHCTGTERGPLVEQDIKLDGDPDDLLRWDNASGTLGMRSSYSALFPCRKGGGLCPREAISFWLATPKENIVDIRYRKIVPIRHGERSGAWMGTIVGSIFVLGGAALITGLSVANGKFTAVALVPAAPFMALGGVFAAAGIRGLTATDSETTIYSSDPKPARP